MRALLASYTAWSKTSSWRGANASTSSRRYLSSPPSPWMSTCARRTVTGSPSATVMVTVTGEVLARRCAGSSAGALAGGGSVGVGADASAAGVAGASPVVVAGGATGVAGASGVAGAPGAGADVAPGAVSTTVVTPSRVRSMVIVGE